MASGIYMNRLGRPDEWKSPLFLLYISLISVSQEGGGKGFERVLYRIIDRLRWEEIPFVRFYGVR